MGFFSRIVRRWFFEDFLAVVFTVRFGYNVFPIGGLRGLLLCDGVWGFPDSDLALTSLTNLFLRCISGVVADNDESAFNSLFSEVFGDGVDTAFDALKNRALEYFDVMYDYTLVIAEKIDSILGSNFVLLLRGWMDDFVHENLRVLREAVNVYMRNRADAKKALMHLRTMIDLMESLAIYLDYIEQSKCRVKRFSFNTLKRRQDALAVYFALEQVLEYIDFVNNIIIIRDNGEHDEVRLSELTESLREANPEEVLAKLTDTGFIKIVAGDEYAIWSVNYLKKVREHLKKVGGFKKGSERLSDIVRSSLFLSPLATNIKNVRMLLFRNLQFFPIEVLINNIDVAFYSALISTPRDIKRLIMYVPTSEGLEGIMWAGILNIYGKVILSPEEYYEVSEGKGFSNTLTWHPFIITAEYFGYRERDKPEDDPLWSLWDNWYLRLDDLRKVVQIKFLDPVGIERIRVIVNSRGELEIRIPGAIIAWYRNFEQRARIESRVLVDMFEKLIDFGIISQGNVNELRKIIAEAKAGNTNAVQELEETFYRRMGSDARRAIMAIYKYVSQFDWMTWLTLRGMKSLIRISIDDQNALRITIPDYIVRQFSKISATENTVLNMNENEIIDLFGKLAKFEVITADKDERALNTLTSLIRDAENGDREATAKLKELLDAMEITEKQTLVKIYDLVKTAEERNTMLIDGLVKSYYTDWSNELYSIVLSTVLPEFNELKKVLVEILADTRDFFVSIQKFFFMLNNYNPDIYERLTTKHKRLKNACMGVATDLGIEVSKDDIVAIISKIIAQLSQKPNERYLKEISRKIGGIIGHINSIKTYIMQVRQDLSGELKTLTGKIKTIAESTSKKIAELTRGWSFIELISQITGLWHDNSRNAIHVTAEQDFLADYLSLAMGVMRTLNVGSMYWRGKGFETWEYRFLGNKIVEKILSILGGEGRRILAINYLWVWKDFIFKFIQNYEDLKRYYRGELSDEELEDRPILRYLIEIIEDLDTNFWTDERKKGSVKKISEWIRSGEGLARIILKLVGGSETIDIVKINNYIKGLEEQLEKDEIKTKKDAGILGTGLKGILGKSKKPKYSGILLTTALARISNIVLITEQSVGLNLLMNYMYGTKENWIALAVTNRLIELIRLKTRTKEHSILKEEIGKIIDGKSEMEETITILMKQLRILSETRMRGIAPKLAYTSKALLEFLELATIEENGERKFVNKALAKAINRTLRATVWIDKIVEELARGEIKDKTIEIANSYLKPLSTLQINKEKESIIIHEHISCLDRKGNSVNILRKIAEIRTDEIRSFSKDNEKEETATKNILLIRYNHPLTETNLISMASRKPEKHKSEKWERLCYEMLPLVTGEVITVKNNEIKWHRGQTGSRITIHTLYELAQYIEMNIGNEKELLFKILWNGIKIEGSKILGLQKIYETLSKTVSKKNSKGIDKKDFSRILESLKRMKNGIMEKDKEGSYKWKSIFSSIGLRKLDELYRRQLTNEINKVIRYLKDAIEDGFRKDKLKYALNTLQMMLERIRTLEARIGTKLPRDVENVLKNLLIPRNKNEIGNAVKKLRRILNLKAEEEETIVEKHSRKTLRLDEILSLSMLFLSAIANPNSDHLRLLPKHAMSRELKHELKTGFITGLMSMIGAVTGSVALLTSLASGNTWILDFLNFKMPTIAWAIVHAILLLVMITLLRKEIVGGGKLLATGVAGAGGLIAYAQENKAGIFGMVPFHVLLSAVLWVWDEYDDFQDAWARVKGASDSGGFMDVLELLFLPFVLGLFGSWMGIDQLLIATRIPGRWGFIRYVSNAVLPEPWSVVVSVAYEIVEFLIANVVASGARGVGWVLYTTGSVLGSFLVDSLVGSFLF